MIDARGRVERLFPRGDFGGSVDREQITIQERIACLLAGTDMRLQFLIRNMQGATPELHSVIRQLAGKASREDRPLRVMEIRNGPLLASLSFQGGVPRDYGDFMVYDGVPHDSPKVISAGITNYDFISSLLSSGDDILPDSEHHETRLTVYELLARITGASAERSWNLSRANLLTDASKGMIKAAYEKVVRKGLVDITVGVDPIAELAKKVNHGNRYELCFPDLSASSRRIDFLNVIQASLSVDGYAFVPLTWWSLGIDQQRGDLSSEEHTLIKDVVISARKQIDIGEYLASEYSSAYTVAHYPGADTLIVRGTRKPVVVSQVELHNRDNEQLS